MTAPIRVLIADDHAVVREGLLSVLGTVDGFEVVGAAADGDEALELALENKPDVVVLDISMPHRSGLQLTPVLREALPATRILILSIHDDAEYVRESVRAGADGYLRKDAAPAELREAIRSVYNGESFFTGAIARQLDEGARMAAQQDARRARLDSLTGRELDVLLGISAGETNREIAARLGISPRTVESHRESLMRKLAIRTVAGLTRFSVEMGLDRQ